jgi:hypothetical protein
VIVLSLRAFSGASAVDFCADNSPTRAKEKKSAIQSELKAA